MLEQFIELLPAILAGLAPSLMALVPTIVVAVKNIKINKQVDSLLDIVDNLKQGNVTIGEALDSTLKQVNDVKSQVIKEFETVHEQAKEAITKDVGALQEEVNKQIRSFEQNMNEIQIALMQNIERMNNNDNVPKVPEETSETVHPE